MLKLGNNRCIGKSLERELPTASELLISPPVLVRFVLLNLLSSAQ